jgi:heat shock protein HtpX
MFLDLPAAGIFASHPSIEKRIAALVEYAGGHDLPVSAEAARAPLAAPEPVAPEFGRRESPPASPSEAGPPHGPWG